MGMGQVLTTALVIVPGENDTVTFVHQDRGHYAGYWLLPGGKVEFGEPVPAAARREAREESGCDVGEMLLTGAYEIHGPDHHFLVWVYRSKNIVTIPERFHGHNVRGVRQTRWDMVEPHPTDMPILNDADSAAYPAALIEDRLGRHRIAMTNLLTGERFGHPAARPGS